MVAGQAGNQNSIQVIYVHISSTKLGNDADVHKVMCQCLLGQMSPANSINNKSRDGKQKIAHLTCNLKEAESPVVLFSRLSLS